MTRRDAMRRPAVCSLSFSQSLSLPLLASPERSRDRSIDDNLTKFCSIRRRFCSRKPDFRTRSTIFRLYNVSLRLHCRSSSILQSGRIKTKRWPVWSPGGCGWKLERRPFPKSYREKERHAGNFRDGREIMMIFIPNEISPAPPDRRNRHRTVKLP